ncbi:MAG: hypothetical protein WCR44_05905 [Verrucomicrobiota bacterium]
MGLDIRYPIGMMFTLIGILLAGTGLMCPDKLSLGININMIWGTVLFLFGILMWGSALLSSRNK